MVSGRPRLTFRTLGTVSVDINPNITDLVTTLRVTSVSEISVRPISPQDAQCVVCMSVSGNPSVARNVRRSKSGIIGGRGEGREREETVGVN